MHSPLLFCLILSECCCTAAQTSVQGTLTGDVEGGGWLDGITVKLASLRVQCRFYPFPAAATASHSVYSILSCRWQLILSHARVTQSPEDTEPLPASTTASNPESAKSSKAADDTPSPTPSNAEDIACLRVEVQELRAALEQERQVVLAFVLYGGQLITDNGGWSPDSSLCTGGGGVFGTGEIWNDNIWHNNRVPNYGTVF